MQEFCWLCLLVITLSLVLWYSHVTRTGDAGLASLGLRGYERILPSIISGLHVSWGFFFIVISYCYCFQLATAPRHTITPMENGTNNIM